jgi:hypothetical protein
MYRYEDTQDAARFAREQGTSMKLVICQALQAAGVKVAEADLEDRTPPRQRAA